MSLTRSGWAAAAACLIVAGCGSGGGPTLQVVESENNYAFEIVWNGSTLGTPYSAGTVAMCVSDSTMTAEITSVTPSNGAGVAIEAFGTQPTPSTDIAALDELGVTSRTVSTPCAASLDTMTADNVTFVNLQLARTTSGTSAVLHTALVSWTIGDIEGRTTLPVHVVMCDPINPLPQCS